MIVSLVVAAAENNVIGKDNRLLWHLPNDMAFFKNITWAMPVIMGRKTYESLGKPLKGRTNIVITRQTSNNNAPGIIWVNSLQEAIEKAKTTDAKECYVIGGGEIYHQAIGQAHKIYLTRVHAVLDGDAFFPAIDKNVWEMEKKESHEPDEKHAYAYQFETWIRK